MTDVETRYRQRLADALSRLKTARSTDPAMVAHLGYLTARLVDRSGRRTWAELKPALTPDALVSLVGTLETQGKQLTAKGNTLAAFAIELVALSLVGRTYDNSQTLQGVTLLDQAIERAILVYRLNRRRAKPTS